MNHQRYFDRHVIEDPHGSLEWRTAPGGTAEIVEIAVSNLHRRQGIGRRMVQQMISELPADIETVYLFTSAYNTIAQEFYQALGFRGLIVESFYRGHEHAMLFQRNVR